MSPAAAGGGDSNAGRAPERVRRPADADTVGGVLVLDLDAGREVTNIPAPHTSGLALSPDGQRLYLARDTEVALPPAPDHVLVLDAVDITAITRTVTTPGSDIDSGPPAQLIGSLTDTRGTSTPTGPGRPGGRWPTSTPSPPATPTTRASRPWWAN